MTKYGFMMELKEMSRKLKLARERAGLKLGLFWKNGNPKPMTQVMAAHEIGVSIRKYRAVELKESGFASIYTEKRALDFISKNLVGE